MSAKLLRLKQLQNQLSEANFQLNELYTENRLLRALQKRQDLALDRYEGAQAQLPQLVRSHHEEVRVLRLKYRNLKLQYRDISKTLKDREAELLNLKEQHSHLLKLSRDRNLGEREALNKQVLELQSTVTNQKNTIQVLNRRVLLESKNLKHQLHLEMQRHKVTQSELQNALTKMENLQSQLEQSKEKQGLPVSMQRLGKPTVQPCSRLTGNATLDKIQQGSGDHPNNKPKYSFPKYNLQNIPPTTDPSSDQPDSSMATFSEKTNEFSTSMDSSPDHVLDIISTSDTSSATAPVSSSGPAKKCTPISKDQVQTNSNHESPRKGNFTSSEALDTEYKQALNMLSELSAKDRGDYDEQISCALSSADEVTAKRVAALANATFAVKGVPRERRSSSLEFRGLKNTILDELSVSVTKEFQHFNQSAPDSPAKERRTIAGVEDAPFLKEKIFDVSIFENSKPGKNTKMPWEEYTPITPSIDDLQEFVSAKESLEMKTADNGNRPLHDEEEDYHKEALLKALKAIDDESISRGGEDSGSDDSDSGITKQASKAVRPGSMFAPINSSGVGVRSNFEHLMKRKPFK